MQIDRRFLLLEEAWRPLGTLCVRCSFTYSGKKGVLVFWVVVLIYVRAQGKPKILLKTKHFGLLSL